MELYSATTRFALACNASEKIIEPIQSRCAIVRFTRLSDQEVLERAMKVVEAEEVPYVPDGIEVREVYIERNESTHTPRIQLQHRIHVPSIYRVW